MDAASPPRAQWPRRAQLVKQRENLDAELLEPTDERPEPDEGGAAAGSSGKQHVGPLGIFFKVWSLVKVTRDRHQRNKLRRQNSDEFRYFAGDHFGQRPPTLLNDAHFRRGDQSPASAATGTSGSSSGSGEQPAAFPTHARRQALAAQSARRANAAAESHLLRAGESGAGWAARLRRSATSVARVDAAKYRSASGEPERRRPAPSSRLQQHSAEPPARPRRGSEPTAADANLVNDDDDDDSDDIYSTPHDSIQSVPSSTRAFVVRAPTAPASHQIVKSRSATNFGQLVREAGELRFRPIDELAPLEAGDSAAGANFQSQDSSGSGARRSSRANGSSRFFISSSSSEDSGCQQPAPAERAHPQPAAQLPFQPLERIPEPRARVQLELGVHAHNGQQPAAQRPDFLPLLVPGGACSYVELRGGRLLASPQSQLLVAAVSPLALRTPLACLVAAGAQPPAGYRKSPSLFEISAGRQKRLSSGGASARLPAASFGVRVAPPVAPPLEPAPRRVANSVSLHDCKAADERECGRNHESPEYKLTRMLLEVGANPDARDQLGQTALMQAILSDNLPAARCLVERGVDLGATNSAGLSALDLLCLRAATEERVQTLKLLVEHHAEFDGARPSDRTRLLDRLIEQHSVQRNKLPYIECLLESGAKLGSSTWAAASGKADVQLRLLRKLCLDGYFLYKKSSIEAAVYRFEYAIRQLAALERQPQLPAPDAARQLKYQLYLGLSRCERKRKFYKRALEFAHLAILVDSSAYEAFYSKAHILKDLGESDDSLLAIDQTARIVDKSIGELAARLAQLEQLEAESLLLERQLGAVLPDPRELSAELMNNLDYLAEAKRHVAQLRGQILADKLGASQPTAAETSAGRELEAMSA